MSFSSLDDTLEYQYDYEFEGGEYDGDESEGEYKLKESETVDDFEREWRGEDTGEREAEEEGQKIKEIITKRDEVKEEAPPPEKEKVKPEKKRTRKKVIFFGDDDVSSEDETTTEQITEEKAPTRRKTIFDLDAFAAFASLAKAAAVEENEEEEEEIDIIDDSGIRFSDTMGIEGIARIDLSPLTQKIVGVVIDENVTTEFPWLYVRKEIIEDNLDLHSESSDFLPVKQYIERYPAPRMLLGYSPTTNEDEGQFYICLTEEARDAVARVIEARRLKQQDKVRNAVLKTPGKWSHLGSGDCVSYMTVKRARALYEIQIEASASQLKAPMSLSDRKSGDQRDGYVEVVPYRESFSNVTRLLVDKDVKAIPSLEDSEAQTILATQVNSSCQCQLNVEPTAELPPTNVKQAKTMLESLKSRVDYVCEEVHSNTLWDVYANDYTKLAESSVGPLVETRGSTEYVERQSYYEGKLCTGRVINDLAWHPHWTGVAAAVYTEISKSENLVGPKPFKEDLNENCVLIWSLDDSLGPKLILESKRQITAVSFHPRNGNIVVGGCVNGQIAVWDITGKIEEVETVVVKTADQVKYESVLKGMTSWMKETLSSMVVRPTVTSSLQYSQKGQITKIDWLSSYKKINERGILEDLPEDATEDILSSQFATSSLDGSIAFYDLNWRPPEDKKKEAQKKKRKTVEKPAGLVQSISPYKVLDNIFKPLYCVIAQYDNESRNAIVTAMSLRRPSLRKQQVQPFPRNDEVTVRKYYKILPEKQQQEESIPTRIFIGTMRGECGLVSWEGYDFSTGITLTKEMCKWIWRKQLHDGPVVHAVRSRHLRDLVATVGGKIFAVWRDDFDEPILWRSSESRYTSCCWAAERPSVIIVGRNDGTVEIWDLFVKSHEPSATHSLSGRIITGIYAHELPLNPQCVGFCDYNGALRIFLEPAVSFAFGQSDTEWMRRFVDREVERIKDFEAWRKEWQKIKEESTADQEKTAEQDDSKKVSEEEEKLKDEALKAEAARKAKAKKRKNLVEEMHAKWVTRELGRMQVAILTKKGLREEELERRIEPVLRMKREARERDLRRQQFLDKAPKLFEDAVASNFPQQRDQLLATDDAAQRPAPPSSSADLASSSIPDFIASMDKTSDEDIIREYEEIESEALDKIRQRQELHEQQELDFSWRRLITDGIKRRRSMDVNLKARQLKTTHQPEDYDLSSNSFESFESRR